MKSTLPTLAAAAAALFLGLSAPAAADDYVSLGSVGNWQIFKTSTHCTGTGGFRNGTRLTFNISPSGAATIVIFNNQWDIPEDKYSVTASVDRAQPVTLDALGGGKLVQMIWPLTPEQINLMSNGVVFRANVGVASYEYGLTGSGAMLRAVVNCAGDLAAAANPFAGQPSASAPPVPTNPFPETASNPYRRM
jgi:hypothetical protein